MRTSPRVVDAYLRQVVRVLAVEDLRQLQIITAPNSERGLRQLQQELSRRAGVETGRVITDLDEIKKFVGSMGG